MDEGEGEAISFYNVKTIVIGNIDVGKSKLVERFVANTDGESMTKTSNLRSYRYEKHIVRKHETIKFVIWDTAVRTLCLVSVLIDSKTVLRSIMDYNGFQKSSTYLVKVTITGNNGVGKTNFIRRYFRSNARKINTTSTGVFEGIISRTCGSVRMRIIDTAGQERYRSLTASYYRGAHGCLILFDVTKPDTFESVGSWFHDLNVYSQNPDRISTILVGTKCLSPKREVPKEKAEKFAEYLGIPYMEVSTEDGFNVTKVFEKLADMIIDSFQRHPSLIIETLKSTNLTQSDHKKKTWCSC
ncbi:hypothetical protein KUTeg_010244 [Tegillarca granosa]|uniref:Uncharacterized protein n=1 Tax=Tegillarca granosa TaxID=220873 RepID=A0ABQ9F8E9_TEGGR|nr:hypothetical protein KUTeg_010244 [Tegillarca granosa]